jgi:hypothetical protein
VSLEEHEDDCPGCRPAMIDQKTGEVLSEDHPYMKAVMTVWRQTTLPQRQAFHRVCCLNSREPVDLQMMQVITDQIRAAMSELN